MKNIKFQVAGFRFQLKRALLAMLLLFPSSLFPLSAQPVSNPEATGRVGDGLIYYLPKTAIEFHLQVEKRVYTPGELAPYAEKYLLVSGIEQEQTVSYSIVNFGLNQIGIRDTSKCYHVKLKGTKNENGEFHLTDDGVLQSMNAEPMLTKPYTPFKASPKPTPTDPHHYLPADVLKEKNLEKRAEKTEKYMQEMNRHRLLLLVGKAPDQPADEETAKKMAGELEQQYDILMTLFTGSVTRDTTEQMVIVCPEKEVTKEVIFKVEPTTGLVDKSHPTGIPYFMTVEDMHRTTMQPYDLPDNKKDGSFFLNVPGRIKLSFYRENHFLAAFDLYAAQFGFVEQRSGSLFKRYVTHMQLNPTTGSVEKIHADM